MFLQAKTAAIAATVALITSPAYSAVVDIFATASLTKMTRTGIFNKDEVDLSTYSWMSPEIEDNIPELFSGANIGDTVSIQWKMDTEAGHSGNYDPENNFIDARWHYYFGLLETTFTLNGTSWTVYGSDGSNVVYDDTPNEFGLYYENTDFEGSIGLESSSSVQHIGSINVRPDDYVTSKGLMNAFELSGDNLGTGSLNMVSGIIVETEESEYEDIYSRLLIDYQITSLKASLQSVQLASMPLPPGALLIASALLGFGLLRRRYKA